MPVYIYQCSECGEKFEETQKITAEPLENCPNCGGRLKRVITGGNAVIFKGPGFHT